MVDEELLNHEHLKRTWRSDRVNLLVSLPMLSKDFPKLVRQMRVRRNRQRNNKSDGKALALLRSDSLSLCQERAPASTDGEQKQRAWMLYLMAKALCARGEHAQAVKQLELACKLAPEDAFYHFELGELYLKLQRLEEAAEHLEAAMLCSPLDDYYHARFAAVCVRLGRLDKAAEVMERAVKLRPRNAFYRYLLAKLYESLNMPELAEPHKNFISELDSYDLIYIRLFQTVWMGYT